MYHLDTHHNMISYGSPAKMYRTTLQKHQLWTFRLAQEVAFLEVSQGVHPEVIEVGVPRRIPWNPVPVFEITTSVNTNPRILVCDT